MPECDGRSVAHLDDDAFALVLGLQSSREEVHEGLNVRDENQKICDAGKVSIKAVRFCIYKEQK